MNNIIQFPDHDPHQMQHATTTDDLIRFVEVLNDVQEDLYNATVNLSNAASYNPLLRDLLVNLAQQIAIIDKTVVQSFITKTQIELIAHGVMI